MAQDPSQRNGFLQQIIADNRKYSKSSDQAARVENGENRLITNNSPYATQKRSRDATENQYNCNFNVPNRYGVPGQGFANQSEADFIISQYDKKIKMEIAGSQYGELLLGFRGVKEQFMQKYKEQDAQILYIQKLNMELEERMKSLDAEANLWKEIINTSEANIRSLRHQLNNVMAQVSNQAPPTSTYPVVVADHEGQMKEFSLCESNNVGKEKIGVDPGRMSVALTEKENTSAGTSKAGGTNRRIMCKICGERKSSVLLLSCRHLCLCTVCGSTVKINRCPVCDIPIRVSVHVNLT